MKPEVWGQGDYKAVCGCMVCVILCCCSLYAETIRSAFRKLIAMIAPDVTMRRKARQKIRRCSFFVRSRMSCNISRHKTGSGLEFNACMMASLLAFLCFISGLPFAVCDHHEHYTAHRDGVHICLAKGRIKGHPP